MKTNASLRLSSQEAEKNEHFHLDPGRLAYTPGEFAKCFGHAAVWGYREIYAGRVRILDQPGRFLIPRSEVERFLAQIVVYSGRPVKVKAVSNVTAYQDSNAR